MIKIEIPTAEYLRREFKKTIKPKEQTLYASCRNRLKWVSDFDVRVTSLKGK